MLPNFYCEEVQFAAQYPEAEGQVFTAQPYGSWDTLQEYYLKMKQNIFRKFFGKNKNTEKYCNTKYVLLEMLSSDDPAVSEFLPKNGVLRQVMKACLVQVISSCDTGQVFSVFN